jgi:hypothetical protein
MKKLAKKLFPEYVHLNYNHNDRPPLEYGNRSPDVQQFRTSFEQAWREYNFSAYEAHDSSKTKSLVDVLSSAAKVRMYTYLLLR